jgi:hypothetical protein
MGEDSDTDEDEALVGLGAALHAAEQLVHQIQRRHVLQVRRHRRRRLNGKRSNSRALGGRWGRGACLPRLRRVRFCWAFRFLFGWDGTRIFYFAQVDLDSKMKQNNYLLSLYFNCYYRWFFKIHLTIHLIKKYLLCFISLLKKFKV